MQIEQTEWEVAAINGEMMTRRGRFSVKAGKPHSGGHLPDVIFHKWYFISNGMW